MKLAISTDQGFVSAHFGRCQSYTIVEIKDGEILSSGEIPNPGHQPGFLPEYLSEKGINCIIAGGMGPRAQGLFAQKNIETIIGVQGVIDEIINKFIKQELEAGDDLCGHQHGEEAHSSCDHHAAENNLSTGTKICITSKGTDLSAEVDPRFGRARYFLMVDPRSMDIEVIENPNVETAHGAGIQAAQLVSSKNVGVVLTGNCGPKAQSVLQSSGIKIITDVCGKAADALSKYKSEGD
ncbi:NifB/NifX family molybdenum-iron cluster-binding protein [Acidobacteriota bacterium]